MRTTAIEFPARGQMHFFDLGGPPDPQPTQVLLETLYSGITNGTERHGLMGDHGWDAYPGRHGYQHVCRVAKVGRTVDDLQEGDVVFYGDYVGHRGWHVVEAVHPKPLIAAIDEGIEQRRCALLGVAGVAMRAVRRLRVQAGQKVWVVGVGPIGIFAAQCSRASGAHVTVSEVVDQRLEVADQTGAHCVVDMRQDNAWGRVAANAPFDAIIDAAGYERLFFDIFENQLMGHGTAVGAIAVRGETTFPWAMLHTTEASIEVSCHFSVSELHCLLHFIRTRLVQIEPVVSHFVSVDEAPGIYATMRDEPRDLYGVIFDWN